MKRATALIAAASAAVLSPSRPAEACLCLPRQAIVEPSGEDVPLDAVVIELHVSS